MADTLTRLYGPAVVAPSDAGTTLYTPKTGELTAIKNAILTNKDPNRGAWVSLSIGAISTYANRLFSDLYIPPQTTVPVVIDVPLNAGESLIARSFSDGTASGMAVTEVIDSSTTTDATTYASASWVGVSGAQYLMFVGSTHATAAAAPTSVTDTHSGVTWTKINDITSSDLTHNMSAWRAASTGTTNTTTTPTWGITVTSASIWIGYVTNTGTGGTHGSYAFTNGGTFQGSATSETAWTALGSTMMGARFCGMSSTAGGSGTAGTGWTEVQDTAVATPTNLYYVEYNMAPGANADATLTATTNKIASLVGVQDANTPVTVTVNGVVIK